MCPTMSLISVCLCHLPRSFRSIQHSYNDRQKEIDIQLIFLVSYETETKRVGHLIIGSSLYTFLWWQELVKKNHNPRIIFLNVYWLFQKSSAIDTNILLPLNTVLTVLRLRPSPPSLPDSNLPRSLRQSLDSLWPQQKIQIRSDKSPINLWRTQWKANVLPATVK